jgi:hypothetical protein
VNWFRSKVCAHVFDSCNLHRFRDDVVAGMCWKCEKVFTAPYGLALPGTLGCKAIQCPTCNGVGKVHAPKPSPESQGVVQK